MGTIAGQVLGDVRGKIGSMVFSRNAKGKSVKGYIYLNQPGTALQLSNRAKFQEAINSWSALDLAGKKYYRDIARFNGFKKGGYQFYVKLYMLGNIPVPLPSDSSLFEKTFSVAELLSTNIADLVVLPPLTAPFYYLFRMCQTYSSFSNFDTGVFVIKFPMQGVELNVINSLRIPYYQFFRPAEFLNSEFNSFECFKPVVLTNGGWTVSDLGGSSGISIQIEYSIRKFFGL